MPVGLVRPASSVLESDKTPKQYLINEQIKLRSSFNYYRFNQIFHSIAHRCSYLPKLRIEGASDEMFVRKMRNSNHIVVFSLSPSHWHSELIKTIRTVLMALVTYLSWHDKLYLFSLATLRQPTGRKGPGPPHTKYGVYYRKGRV